MGHLWVIIMLGISQVLFADTKAMSQLMDTEIWVGKGGMDVNDGTLYNIWTQECHNASNYFVINSEKKRPKNLRGIITCNGDLALTTQAGHTFNWEAESFSLPGKKVKWKVCFYNWGSKYCFMDNRNIARENYTPDVTRQTVITGLELFCEDQYNGEFGKTRALPAGKLVAVAGRFACLRTSLGIPLNFHPLELKRLLLSPTRLLSKADQERAEKIRNRPTTYSWDECNQCCKDSAELWTSAPRKVVIGEAWDKDSANFFYHKYVNDCREVCDGLRETGPMALGLKKGAKSAQ